MKKLFSFRLLAAILGMLLVFGATDSFAQRKKPVIKRKTTVKKKVIVRKPIIPVYTVQKGETFRVRMNETLSSKTARIGDRFTTTVTEPMRPAR